MTKGLLALVFLLLTAIACGPTVSIDGDAGRMRHKVSDSFTPELAGFSIASDVYDAVMKYRDLKQLRVEIEIDIVGGGLQDKYGNRVPGPYIMGEMVLFDLDEIRRYRTQADYALQMKVPFGAELRQMKYANFMGEK